MKRKGLILVRALTLVCAVAAQAMAQTADPTPARRAELISLVRQDCGSCHGMTLKGGLGPALLPATLGGQSLETLKSVILFGRPGTAMPPWQRFLAQNEAEWIAINLQQGFPKDR